MSAKIFFGVTMLVVVIVISIGVAKGWFSSSSTSTSESSDSSSSNSPTPSQKPTLPPKCWSFECENVGGTQFFLKTKPIEVQMAGNTCPPGSYKTVKNLKDMTVKQPCPLDEAITNSSPCWIATNCTPKWSSGIITEAIQNKEGIDSFGNCVNPRASVQQRVGQFCPSELQKSINNQYCWKPTECGTNETCAYNASGQRTCISQSIVNEAAFDKPNANGQCQDGYSKYDLFMPCPTNR